MNEVSRILSEKIGNISEMLDTENKQIRIDRLSKLLGLPRPTKAKVFLGEGMSAEVIAENIIKYAEMSYNHSLNGNMKDTPLELDGIPRDVIKRLASWYEKEIGQYLENLGEHICSWY